MFYNYIKDLLCSVPLWVSVMALCTIVGVCILSLVISDKDKRKSWLVRLFLCVYVMLMLCSTVIFRETRTIPHHGFHPFWHYEAFRQGKLLLLPELIMNILVFIPVGFVFCLAFRRIKWWQSVIVGMGLSIGIELLQLIFKRGCADVDDVIHNTLGCLMGCCLYLVVWRCHNKRSIIEGK